MKTFFRYLLIGLAPMLLLPSVLPAAGEETAAGQAVRQPADVAALLDSLGRGVSRFQTLKTDFTQEKRLGVQNVVLLRDGSSSRNRRASHGTLMLRSNIRL
jgi:hypothetical protein